MFEYNGVELSLAELQQEATERNVSLDDLLKNNPEIKQLASQKKEEPDTVVNEFDASEELKTADDLFKANLKRAKANMLEVPAFFNRWKMSLVRKFGFSDEQKEKFDKLSAKEQDAYAQIMGSLPTPGNIGAFAKEGQEAATKLRNEAEELEKNLIQYDSDITDTIFKEGNVAEGATRLLTQAIGAIPSIGQAMIPYVGIPSIVAGSAAEASREAVYDEGKKIDFQQNLYASGIGASEGLLEIFTKRIGTTAFKNLIGKPKDVVKKTLLQTGTGIVKAGGQEGLSETGTLAINKFLESKYYDQKGGFKMSEQRWDEFWNEAGDTFLIGMATGKGMASAGASGVIVRDAIGNRAVNKSLKKANIKEISEAFVNNEITDNVVELSRNQFSEKALNTELNNKVKIGDLSLTESNEIKLNFKNAQASIKVADNLKIAPSLINETVSLIQERNKLSTKIKEAGENKALVSEESKRLVELDNRLAEISKENISIKLDERITKLEKPIKEPGSLMMDPLGIITVADRIRKTKLEEAKNLKIEREVQNIYNEKGIDGAFDIIEKFKPIVKKLVDKREGAPNFDRELLTSEIEIGLFSDKKNAKTGEIKQRSILGLIREYPAYVKKQKQANKEAEAKSQKQIKIAPLSGFINKQLPKRMIEASRKILGKEFTEDIGEIKESRIELDNTTQEALDLQGTRTPEQNAKLNDMAGITKEEAQQNAKQILKSKLPGILEKSGRDKNQIRTAINNASVLKVSDKILEEMGGKFTAKEGANNQFASFLSVNYDMLFGDNNIIPDYVKNKLELFKPKQVGRESMTEGDASGKGKFEYENPTFEDVLNFYTDETKGLSTLRARKERLSDIISPEVIKNEIAEVLTDPEIKKDFLERQELQGKEIPQDAIPKLLEKIDRAIGLLQKEGNKFKGIATAGVSPKLITDSLIGALKIIKKGLKAGLSFQKALSNGIEKFKQSLKGVTKDQKSLAERILNYHIKSVEDLDKLKEGDLIGDLNLFMNNNILDSSDLDDFTTNNKNWKDLVKSTNKDFSAINMRTDAGRKKFLKIAEENGFIEKIPKSVWLTLQGTTDSLLPDKLKKELNLDKEERKTITSADESSLRTYGGNFPFKSVPEAQAWIDSMEAKGKKFAEEGVYKDMTTKVTTSQYNNLENLLDDKDFVQSQKNSLEGIKQLFLTFESLMKQNPEQNIPFVAAMLSSTSAYQGHFMRVASPVTFYEKGYKNEPYTQEHTLPASLVAKYLFLEAANGNIKKSFKHVANNFQQGALTNKSDDKLKGTGYNKEKFTYKEKTPQNWFIKDNIWARYFNINVALQNGGIKPESIVMANGKTIADIYKVNNAGYGIKGVNFNDTIIEDSKNDKANKQQIKEETEAIDLNKDFNNIIENKTGIGSEKRYAKAKAEVAGKGKDAFDYVGIPPSAQDFMGLMYKIVGKGKKGDAQLAWIKRNLSDPFAKAMVDISNTRVALANDFKEIKKIANIAPKTLKNKLPGEPFTVEQAIRVYIWNKQNMDVEGLSKADLKTLDDYVKKNKNLLSFADQLIQINKKMGYPKPDKNWLMGTMTTDLLQGLNTTTRKEALSQWQSNVDTIFSEANMNKLEAAFGKNYTSALNNMLQRMKTGRNRGYPGDKLTGRFVDWLNGSVGAIMFFNMRSAVLQTISSVNFINFNDNNPLKAAAAFGNQPQYWKDVMYIMNSDFLIERRNGLKINVNEADIAEIAAESNNKAKAFVNKLLKAGFLPTQIADSFAIATGGATFYRNRVNSYVKDGLSQKDAEQKAFLDFREITEENQQSSRPDRISQQQAGPLGRIILAFANTPAQYARLIQKAASDLKNGRGDAKTNISKIIYYGAVQNVIFNAMQQALFAIAFGDEEPDDEKESEKYGNIVNGMVDSLLRGTGFAGAILSTAKNAIIKIAKGGKKQDVAIDLVNISPPISSKIRKVRSAGRTFDWNKKEIAEKGLSLDNPAYMAIGQLVSATTNVPLDRGIRKLTNIKDALDSENEEWMRIANALGWQKWELEWKQNKKKKKKSTGFNIEEFERKNKENLKK